MHQSVLLNESLDALINDPGGIYIDGTFGRGGHTQALLDRLNDQAQVFAFDRDPQAITYGRQHINDPRLSLIHSRFSLMYTAMAERHLLGKVSGILLDLGVSSPQLDEAQRGFSFMRDGPLDMRMDPTQGQSVAQWLDCASETEIADVIWRYGEERQSRRIARAIVQDRPFTTTRQLAGMIARVVKSKGDKHPATRTFQALRIHINGELDEVTQWLETFDDILAPDGHAVVISFHSLEDRLIKQHFTQLVNGPEVPRNVPLTAAQLASQQHCTWIIKQYKTPATEIHDNARARSAVMRAVKKRNPGPLA